MKKTLSMAILAVLLTVSMGFLAKKPKWVSLFDGKTLKLNKARMATLAEFEIIK
jgi:hypothetical protein